MEEQLCEELDKTLLELMGSLQQLSEARKKYGAAVSEVGSRWDVCPNRVYQAINT